MLKHSRLSSALAVATLAVTALQTERRVERNTALERLPIPQPSPRNTKSPFNREQQFDRYQAAENKRARRQARNLRNAGMTQESTL